MGEVADVTWGALLVWVALLLIDATLHAYAFLVALMMLGLALHPSVLCPSVEESQCGGCHGHGGA